AALDDEGRGFILALVLIAAAASVWAVGAELSLAKDAKGLMKALRIGLAFGTVVGSWLMVQMIFALHYAHEFYGEDEGPAGGLLFPGGDDTPDYWDFVYFAFVIGMTSQVSDVSITSKEIRRTVIAHGIVSFVFNVALLALTINLASGLLAGAG
ncbi:MAG TPA: DUF1345 domain-containing protein, partial [Methylomirabilota bacterium]|nr:DUF1345 domain-containing protein [Methylomirabilota bacterium]